MNMNTESVNTITSTVFTSLDKTQKNALNTDSAVGQILALSGQGLHADTVKTVLSCSDMDTEKKIHVIRELNSDHDQRIGNNFTRYKELQSSQTQNVNASTSKWAYALLVFTICLVSYKAFLRCSLGAAIVA